MQITLPNHIIAIGASAGSMDEINSFFDYTSPDGVSYIIVQHLSPDFKSRMVELLSRHSKLKVIEAENGMTVQRNHVYLIPNDKLMTISNNILQLSDKSKYILYNLISNGIKFKGSAPPIITIYSKMEKDTVVLIIEDNGMGIPKKGLGKIFDMYGRLHRDVEGNGIGLYLAKKIIDAANGNIVVESEPGKGTRFIVYLKQGV